MVTLGDRLFVALAKQSGVPSHDALRACRALQLEQRARGRAITLFAMARRCGLLDAAEARAFLERAARAIAREPRCAGELILDPEAEAGEEEAVVCVAARWVPDAELAAPSGGQLPVARTDADAGLLPEDAEPVRGSVADADGAEDASGPIPRLLPLEEEADAEAAPRRPLSPFVAARAPALPAPCVSAPRRAAPAAPLARLVQELDWEPRREAAPAPRVRLERARPSRSERARAPRRRGRSGAGGAQRPRSSWRSSGSRQGIAGERR